MYVYVYLNVSVYMSLYVRVYVYVYVYLSTMCVYNLLANDPKYIGHRQIPAVSI